MKTIYVGLIMLMFTTIGFAQDGNGSRRGYDREKMEAARIAFLTNRLELDSETAKVFWPIFTEYEKEKGVLFKKYNAQKRALYSDRTKALSDENADKMLDIYLGQKQASLDLEKKYLNRFKEVLTHKQVWMVIRFDSDFRRSIMQRIGRERRQRGKEEKQNTDGN